MTKKEANQKNKMALNTMFVAELFRHLSLKHQDEVISIVRAFLEQDQKREELPIIIKKGVQNT